MFSKNKRKHFFINKSLQSRYIFYVVGTLTIVALASSLSIYFGIWNATLQEFSNENVKNRLEFSTRLREYQDARVTPQSPQEVTLSLIREVDLFSSREREILNEILKNTYKKLYPLFFALLLFIGWGSIFITHKVAGPLFRFESSLKELLNGNLNFRIHLRQGDEGQNLVPIFNQFVEKLDTSFHQMKEATEQLSQSMKKESFPVECMEQLAQIQYELDKYQISRQPKKES